MRPPNLHLLINSWLTALAILIRAPSFGLGLNTDGVLLLSFKYSITSDPFQSLLSWNSDDDTPCSWNGVTCGTPGSGRAYFRVTGLSLPDSGLCGSLPATLGMIQHLQSINLCNNSINASIPSTLFSASELQFLDFSNNLLSGTLPELVGNLQNLRLLNLSGNALVGNLPLNLTVLPNLTSLSLGNNYFSGPIPAPFFPSLQLLVLSSNLINGSLPLDLGGARLSYFNASYNRISGEIPPQFADKIPANATVDLSHNNLTGQIPASDLFLHQAVDAFSGNPGLCGEPVRNACPVPSPIGSPPESPPAIAAVPKTLPSNPAAAKRTGLSTGTILAIVIGDIAGIGIITAIFLYVYCARKRKTAETEKEAEEFDWASEEHSWLRTWTCMKKPRRAAAEDDDDELTSESANSGEEVGEIPPAVEGKMVTVVDGEEKLEVETLLRASAYILGASGSSIVYKAVLEDGATLAVRRVGENGVDRFKDFENQIRVIAKLEHPNLVRIRGFYWGSEEKLIIYDFVPNGSLANARFRKAGCSPCPLPWEMRLRIAKGVARGLCYIHEKKHVHGNLKPSNILLDENMEPKIGDFGLERLIITGDSCSTNAAASARNFGSKRSNASRESFQELAAFSPSSGALGVSPYQAPESLRSLKPHPKWDVFSFGVVLLQLLTGKVIVSDETGLGSSSSVLAEEDDNGKVVRMADVAIRAEMEGKEEALLALMRLGYSCISPVPQKRPSMKEALQALENFPITSFS